MVVEFGLAEKTPSTIVLQISLVFHLRCGDGPEVPTALFGDFSRVVQFVVGETVRNGGYDERVGWAEEVVRQLRDER